ncbi:MAG: GntR family transcriptional regulator [Pseudomonadota bacterium]
MSVSPKEACFEDVRLRILRVELAPGAVLDEASLASHYGLSRTPLREVLQRLSGAGYITLKEHRGAKVASMDIVTMRTFFQTAPMVYANIGRLAAENRTDAQLDALQDTQLRFATQTQAGDAAAAALSNHRFHAVIGEMAQNPYLVASLNRLLIDHTRLSQTFYRPRNASDEALVRQACRQHEALISALQAQETERVVDLTLQHWDLSRDSMERFVRPDPLPVDLPSPKERYDAI